MSAQKTIPEFVTKEELQSLIQCHCDRKIAELYQVPYHWVRALVKRYGIQRPKYHGRKLTTNIDHDKAMEIIPSLHISEAARRLRVSLNGIRRFCREQNIEPLSWFDQKEKEQQRILDLFPRIQELHESKPLKEICSELGISYHVTKQLRRQTNGFGIVVHSRNKSKGEKEVLAYLRNFVKDFKSVRMEYGGSLRELDAYSESLKLAVEYCGEYWHQNVDHQAKYLWCKEQGIRLITIFETEWLKNKSIWKKFLKAQLGLYDTEINDGLYTKEIDSSLAQAFHQRWNPTSHDEDTEKHFGLYHKEKLLGVASLNGNGNAIKKVSLNYEIRIKDAVKTLVKAINPDKVILNPRFDNTAEWVELGFKETHLTKPQILSLPYSPKDCGVLICSKHHF